VWLISFYVLTRSGAEALAAGTTCRRVRVLNFEPALQSVQIVQLAPSHVQCALGIHDHANSGALHEEIPIRRRILQIHLVLQTRAPAAHNRDPQNAAGPPLFLQQGADAFGCACSYLDQPFVAHPETGRGGWLGRCCWRNHVVRLMAVAPAVNQP
jgi:hypothetical protein